MDQTDQLVPLCKERAPRLQSILSKTGGLQTINAGALLYAISGNESSFGQRREFVRHEAAYMPGGRYYNRSAPLRALFDRYGVLASSSFGSWQIMAIVAQELSYVGNPAFLADDEISIEFVIRQIIERIIPRGAGCLGDLFDAYNSGTSGDSNIPKQYIEDGLNHYYAVLPRFK